MRLKENDLISLVDLILNINTIHHDYSNQWLGKLEQSINLKKTQVRNVCVRNTIEEIDSLEINMNFIKYTFEITKNDLFCL